MRHFDVMFNSSEITASIHSSMSVADVIDFFPSHLLSAELGTAWR